MSERIKRQMTNKQFKEIKNYIEYWLNDHYGVKAEFKMLPTDELRIKEAPSYKLVTDRLFNLEIDLVYWTHYTNMNDTLKNNPVANRTITIVVKHKDVVRTTGEKKTDLETVIRGGFDDDGKFVFGIHVEANHLRMFDSGRCEQTLAGSYGSEEWGHEPTDYDSWEMNLMWTMFRAL
tara:strand:+ start:1334 stop:1864 length:531 start_codon:yes stop_codon:yes gene_type:complete